MKSTQYNRRIITTVTIVVAVCVVTPPPIGERGIVITVSVCKCVCLSAIISLELHVRSSPYYIWLCLGPPLAAYSDTLCTSGFMDDVI